MRKSSLAFIAIFVAVLMPSPSDGYKIDLYPSYQGLSTRLENITAINITTLITSAMKLLDCLTPTPTVPENPTLFAESEFLVSPIIHDLKINLNFTDRLKEYVKRPEFEEIHIFLWNADNAQWIDMIYFLYNSGFGFETDPSRNIYTWINRIYHLLEVPSHLIETLPPGPPTSPPNPSNTKMSSMSSSSLPWTIISTFQEQQRCTEEEWMAIMKDIVDSQGIQWMELIRFVIGEINGNPSIHASWAKITEADKGVAFRKFRLLDAFTKLIHHWDTQLKNDKLFKLVIQILEGILGINFDELDINVVGNTISILEWLIWGTTFPRP